MGLRGIVSGLDAIDKVLGPNALDLSPTTAQIITRVWSGGARGVGNAVDTPLALPNWITIRHVSQRLVADSGGRLEIGDVVIGPVRPTFARPDGTTGGFTEAQLAPVVATNGTEIIYRLTQEDATAGGINGDFTLYELRRDKTLAAFMIYVKRLNTTPGPT